jgi:hypothetical protein
MPKPGDPLPHHRPEPRHNPRTGRDVVEVLAPFGAAALADPSHQLIPDPIVIQQLQQQSALGEAALLRDGEVPIESFRTARSKSPACSGSPVARLTVHDERTNLFYARNVSSVTSAEDLGTGTLQAAFAQSTHPGWHAGIRRGPICMPGEAVVPIRSMSSQRAGGLAPEVHAPSSASAALTVSPLR